VAEDYRWAITQVAWRSCCGRSDSSVLDFGFKLASLVRPYVKSHMYSQLDLSQRNYFVGRDVSVELELYMNI